MSRTIVMSCVADWLISHYKQAKEVARIKQQHTVERLRINVVVAVRKMLKMGVASHNVGPQCIQQFLHILRGCLAWLQL
jgi:chorismate mutase